MTLETGARLGPYEVLEPIGAGGMGEVYRARELAEGLAKAHAAGNVHRDAKGLVTRRCYQ